MKLYWIIFLVFLFSIKFTFSITLSKHNKTLSGSQSNLSFASSNIPPCNITPTYVSPKLITSPLFSFIQKDSSSNTLCTYSSTKCLKCKANAHLNSTTEQCECNEGYFRNDQLKICQKCHPLCGQCTGQSENECTQCNMYSTLVGSTCKCNTNLIYDSIQQHCVLKEKIFSFTHSVRENISRNDTYQIIYADIIFLHGIFSPKYLNENNEDYFNQSFSNGAATITNEGLRSSYTAGRYLKEKYFSQLGLYNKTELNSNNVFAISHRDNIQTAYAMILGVFSQNETSNSLNRVNLYRKEVTVYNEDSINPFDSSPEIANELLYSSHSLPLISVNTYEKENNEIDGITSVDKCEGIDKIRKNNIKEHKDLLEKYANAIGEKFHRKMSIEEVEKITDSYLVNYNLGNDNITKIDIETMQLIDDFNTLYSYESYYGDEDNYVEKIVIGSWAKRIKSELNQKLNNTVDSKVMTFQFPDEISFIGLSKLLNKISNNTFTLEKIINHSNVIMIDLYKSNNKTEDYLVQIYLDNEKITEIALKDLLSRLESLELKETELKSIDKFCNSSSVSGWWISLCVLCSVVLLQILIMLGIQLFLK